MSHDSNGYPPIQHSFFVNGDQVVFRATTGEEFADTVEGVNKEADRITEAITGYKQAILAKGVFTGTVDEGNGTSTPKARTESGPPSDGDSTPHCKHGPMDDLAGQGYKSRYYCTLKTQNWKEKCKPVN